MELNRLLLPGEYEGEIGNGIEITGISNDGRRIAPGDLFICHKGEKFDAHALLPTLSAAGVVAAVVSDEHGKDTAGIPLLAVEDTRRAEAYAVSRFYGSPGDRLTLIGVTGTNGKTSVSTMLWRVLNDAGIKTGLIGTTGYRGAPENENAFISFKTGEAATMTTPPPLTLYPLLAAMADAGITHVVMEASSQALAVSRVAPLFFSAAVFTNLTPEHLDYHRAMNDYLAAKKILFRQAGIAVVNGDSPWTDLLLDGLSCRRVVCGTFGSCDFTASEILPNGNAGVSYLCKTPEGRFHVSVPIPASFTVTNSLLALATAHALGVGIDSAVGTLAHIPAVPGRMEAIDVGDFPFTVIIDYAHTEAALRSLLLSVRAFRRSGQRIVLLFGCGGDRDPGKRSEMGRTAEELADFTVVTSDNSRNEDPKKIIAAILSGMSRTDKRRVVVDRRRAIEYVIRTAKAGDVILLVGKGHEKYEIDGKGVREFDEKKIVVEALEARRNGHTTEGTNRADRNGRAD